MVRSVVDYSLLMHHTARNKLRELAGSNYTPTRLDKELGLLASLVGNSASGALSLLSETDDPKVTNMVCSFLMKLPSEEVIAQVGPMLHNSRVADTTKADLLRVLSYHGWDIQDLMSPAIFQNVHKLAVDSMEQLLQDLSEDPGVLGNVLEEFAEFSPEMQLAYVQDWAALKDNRVVPIFAALGRSDDEVIAAEAIRALGSLATPEALAALLDIHERLDDDFLLELADRERRRLRFKGIRPANPRRHTPLGELFSTLVTGLDGKGCRIVWIARFLKGSRGKLMAASFLVSVTEGLKDCYGSTHLSRKEARELLKTLKDRYPTVDDDLDYSRAILRDALFTNRSDACPLPPQWSFWQGIFEPDELDPEHLIIEHIPGAPAPPEDVAKLLQQEEFREWYEEDPLVYDAAEEAQKIIKRYKNPLSRAQATEMLLERLATRLYGPKLETVLRRFDLTSDFLRKRAKGPLADMLDAITSSLRTGVESPEHSTLLINLLNISIRVAEHNIRSGYDIRHDPEHYH